MIPHRRPVFRNNGSEPLPINSRCYCRAIITSCCQQRTKKRPQGLKDPPDRPPTALVVESTALHAQPMNPPRFPSTALGSCSRLAVFLFAVMNHCFLLQYRRVCALGNHAKWVIARSSNGPLIEGPTRSTHSIFQPEGVSAFAISVVAVCMGYAPLEPLLDRQQLKPGATLQRGAVMKDRLLPSVAMPKYNRARCPKTGALRPRSFPPECPSRAST